MSMVRPRVGEGFLTVGPDGVAFFWNSDRLSTLAKLTMAEHMVIEERGVA